MIVKKLELYFKAVITGESKGLFPFLLRLFLLPLSWCYALGVNFRNALYDKGWMRCYVAPIPLVISIGNIVAGGTGKTPVTATLIQFFYPRYSLAILSRGYRSKAEKLDHSLIICEGEGPIFPPAYCGDEPYLLAKRFPKAFVVVGSDRKRGAVLATKAGAQIIFLEDGFQHRRLARDLDLVVIDVQDPFGQGHFLPRGFLRDAPTSLKRAHLIVLNHLSKVEEVEKIEKELRTYTSAPFVGMRNAFKAIRTFKGEEIQIPIEERNVGMFCGIAHPAYFRQTLEENGFKIVAETILPDHEGISERKMNQLIDKSLKQGAKWLVCTEKDRVKVKEEVVSELPMIWIETEQQIVYGQEVWDNFLKIAEEKIN